MAKTIFVFPLETKINDTVQLTIEFTVVGAADTYFYPANEGIRVIDYGNVSWEYDPEDPVMVPGDLSLKIHDENGLLEGYVFPGPANTTIDPRAQVKLEINGTTDFLGFIDESSASYTEDDKTLVFDAYSSIEKISNQMLIDHDDQVVDPFGYGPGFARTLITDILEDIFQLADSSIAYPTNLEIIQNWQYHGYDNTGGSGANIVFDFTDLKLNTDDLFNDPAQTEKTAGALLASLAKSFFCFAGLIHNQRAFFRQLFTASGNNQTLGTVLYHRKSYEYNLVDWVRFDSDAFTAGADYAGTYGTETQREDRIIDEMVRVYFWIQTTSPFTIQTNTTATDSSTLYYIYGAKNPGDPAYLNNAKMLAQEFGKWRTNIKNQEIHYFEVAGISYDFLKDFTYNGETFQILALEKDIEMGYSKIKAVNLG